LWKEKVPFFYLIFPQPGYMGFTALPAWAILALFALPDLGGYLASVPDVSSVAYSAHLGGAACGGAMALALRAGLLASDPYDPEQGWQWFEG
jgi:membrane associated rhomboid family serine protease